MRWLNRFKSALYLHGPIKSCIISIRYLIRLILSLINEVQSVSIAGNCVKFSATNPSVIRRNRKRTQTEQEYIRVLLDEIRPNDIFLDVGSNTGLYTCFVAKNCHQVVAVEPYPPNIRELQKNIKVNELTNVEVLTIALSDKNGETTLSVPSSESIGYGSATINSAGKSTTTVDTRKADSLVQNEVIPHPTVVKIDVEGAEGFVLRGMKKILSSETCRVILCEVHPSATHTDVDVIKSQLNELGFEITELDSTRGEIFILGRKPDAHCVSAN